MKKALLILFLFLILTGFIKISEKISLKVFAEEAMEKSIIGKNPIIVISKESAKIYSKVDLTHRIFNNLNKEGLFIIPKNSDLVEEFWGEVAKTNGVLVYMEAHEKNPNMKDLRFVLNGKELDKSIADTINFKNIKGFVCLKKRESEKSIVFFSTQ